jgi:hypothetical protein
MADEAPSALADGNHRPPGYLPVEACLAIALLGAVAGVGLRLLKPVDPPDAALLARLEAWKVLAPTLEHVHHLQRRKGSD